VIWFLVLLCNFLHWFDLVTMQAQKEAPTDMQCKDKFLLQSVKTNDGVTAKDINAEMVNYVLTFNLFTLHVCLVMDSGVMACGDFWLCSSVRRQGIMSRSANWECFMFLPLNHLLLFKKGLRKGHPPGVLCRTMGMLLALIYLLWVHETIFYWCCHCDLPSS